MTNDPHRGNDQPSPKLRLGKRMTNHELRITNGVLVTYQLEPSLRCFLSLRERIEVRVSPVAYVT
jgi:hypothetical protein